MKTIPQFLSNMTWVFMCLMNIMMVKSLDSADITAVIGFSNSCAHGFCVMFFIGINTGFNVFGCQVNRVSQTKFYEQTVKHLFLIMLLTTFYFLLFNQIGYVTQAMGMSASLQHDIKQYLMHIMVAVFLYVLSDFIRQILNVKQVFSFLTMISSVLSLLLHYLLTPVLVTKFGFIGTAYALIASNLFNLIFLLVFLIHRKLIAFRDIPLDTLFKFSYYGKVITVGMSLLLDNSSYCTVSFIVGTMDTRSLAAYSILTSLFANLESLLTAM